MTLPKRKQKTRGLCVDASCQTKGKQKRIKTIMSDNGHKRLTINTNQSDLFHKRQSLAKNKEKV
jgi:hypothetical protein